MNSLLSHTFGKSASYTVAIFCTCGLILLLLMLLPLFGLIIGFHPKLFLASLQKFVVWQAFLVSIKTTLISVLIILLFGFPLSYLLSFYNFLGKGTILTLLELPLVFPPIVGGLGLLIFFGRGSTFGIFFKNIGINVPFTPLALVFVQIFIAAPFFIFTVKSAMDQVDRECLLASASLKASLPATLLFVLIPMVFPAILSGLTASFAKALGELGASLIFAGNFPGVTQSMPLAIYIILQSNFDDAIALSMLLVVTAFLPLSLLKLTITRKK